MHLHNLLPYDRTVQHVLATNLERLVLLQRKKAYHTGRPVVHEVHDWQ